MRIKDRIRRWIGIDSLQYKHDQLRKQFENATMMGCDVGMKRNTTIVIVSQIANGRIEIIHKHYKNLRDFEESVSNLKQFYGIEDKNIYLDLPMGIDKRLFRF